MEKKIVSDFARNNLLLACAYLILGAIILIVTEDGEANPHHWAAVLTMALYFGLIGFPLLHPKRVNLRLVAALSTTFIALLSMLNVGGWIWLFLGLIFVVYEVWLTRKNRGLIILDLFFTVIIAVAAYGGFAILFQLV